MMFRIALVFGLVLSINACANISTIITGDVAEPIDFTEVEVFYNTSPACEFEEIALIKIPGEYYTRAALIDGFREKAAAVGAPAVLITYLQKESTSEYFGSARAIRCS